MATAMATLPKKGSYWKTIEFMGVGFKVWTIKYAGNRVVTLSRADRNPRVTVEVSYKTFNDYFKRLQG